MKIFRTIALTLAVLAASLTVSVVLAYDGGTGHLYGGGASTGLYFVGFAAGGHTTLGFTSGGGGAFPGGVHAVAPPYTVSGNVSDWITTANTSANFTSSTMSPFGILTDLIETTATAGVVPSQLPFILISTVIILAVSLTTSWGFRQMNANGSLFAKGMFSLAIIGLFVATRWWDLWMLIFFLIFFATFGIMSRHQSWQN